MIKYSTNTLKEFENIFKENNYVVRYEKGNFKSGYCILHERKVIVVNKFISLEAKINSLLEVLEQVAIDKKLLSESTRLFYEELK